MPTSRTSRAPRARARKAHPLDNLIREALRDAVLRDEALHGKLPELRETEASPRPAAPTAPRPLKECLVRLRLPASKLAGVDGAAGRITAAATFRLLDDGRVEWKVTALYRGAGSKPLPDDLAGRKLGDMAYKRWLPWPDARGRPSRLRARQLDREALAGWLLRIGIAEPPPGA
jgi:hypothetical protein